MRWRPPSRVRHPPGPGSAAGPGGGTGGARGAAHGRGRSRPGPARGGASARLLQSQLFGVTPRDPLSYTIAVSLLGAAAGRRLVDRCAQGDVGQPAGGAAGRVATASAGTVSS
jgi:hypothetical protein